MEFYFKHLLRSVAETPSSVAALALRCGLGIVMLPHGLQKAFGWFDGGGITGTMQYMTQHEGLPFAIGALVIATEFLCPLALFCGFFARLAAIAIGIEMTVAVLMIHIHRGFFMDWHSNHKGEGYEFHILAVTIALAVAILGAGSLSVDQKIAAKLRA